MERLIKYIRHPAFPAALLTSRNPYLDMGEIVFELDGTNKPKRFKVGPGNWNSLPYFIDDRYTLAAPPTNPIGDATGDLEGLTVREVLEKMLNPYLVPVISNVRNNAAGSFANARTVEIGTSLSGVIRILYEVSAAGNLSGATPINVTAGGIFSNEGNFANTGTIDMNLTAPLSPNIRTQYTINVRAIHQQGQTVPVTTTIDFVPRIIWGVSQLSSYTAADINNLSSKQTIISSVFKRDYNFNGQGYAVVAIPTMLGISNPLFADVTNPVAPSVFSMDDMGTLNINNGVGTYTYQIFRSTYYLTENISILRIS